MMIPPLIRMGPPPGPDALRHPRAELVVLERRRGWLLARWDQYGPALIDSDTSVAQVFRLIDPDNVLCWMPADGS